MTFQTTTSTTINTSTRLIDLVSTGTVSVSSGSATVTGSSTAFLSEVQPGDQLLIAGTLREVATVTNNTTLTLTTGYAGSTASGLSFWRRPKQINTKTKGLWRVTSHDTNTATIFIGETLNATLDGTDVTSTGRSEPLFIGSSLYFTDYDKVNYFIRSGTASQRLTITLL